VCLLSGHLTYPLGFVFVAEKLNFGSCPLRFIRERAFGFIQAPHAGEESPSVSFGAARASRRIREKQRFEMIQRLLKMIEVIFHRAQLADFIAQIFDFNTRGRHFEPCILQKLKRQFVAVDHEPVIGLMLCMLVASARLVR
jgi:hypothetical protein